jgi:hypothetical protein
LSLENNIAAEPSSFFNLLQPEPLAKERRLKKVEEG